MSKMEKENEVKQDCGCDDGCCSPKTKKSKLWTKILFIVVIAAAVTVVIIKVAGNSGKSDNKSTMVQNAKIGAKDTTKPCCAKGNSSCCDKGKK